MWFYRGVVNAILHLSIELLFITMSQEIWKDIPWYEWQYQVSTFGRIKSFKYFRRYKSHILECTIRRSWYVIIWLRKSWKTKTYLVHRIVATVFLDNVNSKPQVNHKDWNKTNNYLSNLEWVTIKENSNHSWEYLWRVASRWNHNNKSKTIIQYDLLWKLIKVWSWTWDIQRELWINRSSISACCLWRRNKAWWYIWKHYIDS